MSLELCSPLSLGQDGLACPWDTQGFTDSSRLFTKFGLRQHVFGSQTNVILVGQSMLSIRFSATVRFRPAAELVA